MVPMSSSNGDFCNAGQQQILRDIARESIRHGIQYGTALPVSEDRYDETLQTPRATFVTLHLHGQLRGCIGTLEAWRPLVRDVSDNAFAAAFRDPRFPPLQQDEFSALDVHISILTPPQAMQFSSEDDLLHQIEPGRDGLVLEESHFRGTFLPSVWESLPEKVDFLRHLKRKAGLPEDYWSDSLKVSRYRVQEF